MVFLELFSQLADKIRYYYVTVQEIQQDADNIQIYLKTNLITRSPFQKLSLCLRNQYLTLYIQDLSFVKFFQL